jgi:hypothetical protein
MGFNYKNFDINKKRLSPTINQGFIHTAHKPLASFCIIACFQEKSRSSKARFDIDILHSVSFDCNGLYSIAFCYFVYLLIALVLSSVKTIRAYAGFEVFTAMIMRNSVFWDISPYSLCHAAFLPGLIVSTEDRSSTLP